MPSTSLSLKRRSEVVVNRSEKVAIVEEMNASFAGSSHVILTTFSGLTANQANELRSKIRGAGGKFRVIKNRLAKLAAPGTPIEPLLDQFTGPCALAAHDSDPVALAKTLAEFGKRNPQLGLLAGVIDAKSVLDASGVQELALLPGLQELRAQLLSLIQTPATSLVRLLGTPGTQLAQVLEAHREKQEKA